MVIAEEQLAGVALGYLYPFCGHRAGLFWCVRFMVAVQQALDII